MRFLLIVHHNEAAFAATADATKRALLAESVNLTHELHAQGQYIDASPLMPSNAGARVSVRGGKASVTDGPFIETREHIAGYFFIRADSLAAAVEVAKRIPGARLGYVEVRELREITGLPEKHN
jgi:hypothetical protein